MVTDNTIPVFNNVTCRPTAKLCKTGESTTAVAREQLCGHVPRTREHPIMEETFSVGFISGLYIED
jgi:hypothetical protein